ncbi:hypothetical protein [Microbacterium sp. H1-D42]|uniref:hypothetical protein n=1 Tax=Microbacterium sp. H1-D42 TaxID=2925844 RepID=UPI001F537837|nr:hypothetical protein [Microbacterium sp. H1-D42]UNK71254.1 hypothetical protein MNR00_02030 [Microbacterium sp. H1-D42]
MAEEVFRPEPRSVVGCPAFALESLSSEGIKRVVVGLVRSNANALERPIEV